MEKSEISKFYNGGVKTKARALANELNNQFVKFEPTLLQLLKSTVLFHLGSATIKVCFGIQQMFKKTQEIIEQPENKMSCGVDHISNILVKKWIDIGTLHLVQ